MAKRELYGQIGGQYGLGQTGQFGGQYGLGQTGQFGGQYGLGQTGQLGVGQFGQYGLGQTGQFSVGQFGGQYDIGQLGVGQLGIGQLGGQYDIGQLGIGQISGQSGIGQMDEVGSQYGVGQLGQTGQFGVGQFGGQFGGQINPQIRGQINPQIRGQINPQIRGQINSQVAGELPLLRMITGEHVEQLISLRMIQEANPEVQRRVFPIQGQRLLAHLQAEEEEFHSLTQGIPQLQQAHAVVESLHVQANRLTNNLLSMQPGTNAWNQTMNELVSVLDQKIAVEQQVLFPAIRSSFNVSQLQVAENRYISRKLRMLSGQMV